MPTLPRNRIRLALDASNFDSPVDAQRLLTPAFWRGVDLQFELALIHADTILDVSNIASLTVEIKPLGATGEAPPAGTTPLMSGATTTFDNTLDLFSWGDNSKQHAVVPFTSTETALEAGTYWLVVTATTTDNPARGLTFAAGFIDILEGGSASIDAAPLLEPYGYTQAQADARFLNATVQVQRAITANAPIQGAPIGAYRVLAIAVKETAGQAITGLQIGTTSGANDVVDATDVPATTTPPLDLVGSLSTFDAPLHVSAANWNSASLDLEIVYQPLSL